MPRPRDDSKPQSASILVRFWGVRGHIPVPGPETATYGGNTPCVEVRCGERLLILDSGTGIRLLGRELVKNGPIDADLFYAHTQFDRICGLPFFAAAFDPKNSFHIWAGHLGPRRSVKGVLMQLMTDPIFPVPLTVMRARLEFTDFRAGETLTPRPGVTARTARFNWTRPVTGYRIEYGGRSVCYLSDIKRGLEANVTAALGLIEKADIVIFNTALEPSMEHPPAQDGWQWGVELCERARAGTLVLSSHGDTCDDAALDRLATELQRARPGSLVAREGLVLTA
jgi:phosphoribosyl 1,2-cyclic phosphodiesterase